MNIRKANLNDAEGIAKIHVDSWRTTYRNIIPVHFLQSLSYDQRTISWNQNFTDKSNTIYVAENNDGEIIGVGTCGKREKNKVEHSGDFTSIYLLEEYQGTGIGKQLLKQLFNQFK